MRPYSKEALGQVVRDLRLKKGLTQEELGSEAGYKGGAGVSISRLENGQLEPSPEKLEGIAKALGLFAEVLAQVAEETTQTPESARRNGSVSIRDRVARVQREIDGRTQLVTDLGQAFNDAHDRAKDDFLMRLVEIAARVDGAPEPDPTQLEGDAIPDGNEAEAEAAYRILFTRLGVAQALVRTAGGAASGAAVGGAASYGPFTAAVASGTASTRAISALSGAAATNGFLAAMRVGTLASRGAGIAGGTALLAGIVAAPVALAAAGGLLWVGQRNRKQHQELAAKLDEVEAEIAEAQPGVDALRELIPRATEILEYIAVHAGHALSRWEAEIGQGPLDWQSLSAGERQRYQDFVEIAAAQLAVAAIDLLDLLMNRGRELERAIARTGEVLTQSREVVTSHA